VVLKTNDGGTGGDYGFGLTSNGFQGSLTYTYTSTSGALTINGTGYTLDASPMDLITAINANASGDFALAQSGN
jgi:hypothetical protein